MISNEPIHYSFHAPELYVILFILSFLGYKYKKKILYILIILLIILILFFYRKNRNPINMEPNTIVSPCEGKILKILKENNHLIVSVFLNVHNVHVQYFPCSGTITKKIYKEGEFQPAYLFEKSRYNEQLQTIMTTRYGMLKINQIAGLIARRIVSFNTVGDHVNKGEPMGLIKFGSRVDTYIPIEYINDIMVNEGDFIKIGDVLCRMRS